MDSPLIPQINIEQLQRTRHYERLLRYHREKTSLSQSRTLLACHVEFKDPWPSHLLFASIDSTPYRVIKILKNRLSREIDQSWAILADSFVDSDPRN